MAIVSVSSCTSYQYAYPAVKEAVIHSFENLGGIGRYIKQGDKVLLKVNLVMKKEPKAAATSHPIFVQALADCLIEYGAFVTIGDSPGGPFNELRLRSIYHGCQMDEAAKKSGAALSYNTGFASVSNPGGVVLKSIENIDMLRDADCVINVCKLKTHGMMKMTGAVKNLFGTIPGTQKAEYHLNRSNPDDFAEALLDICLCAAPVLTFMDGIVAMEGDGPTSGTPREVGVILASSDPFALDLCAAHMIGAPPESIPTVKKSIERGYISKDIADVTLVGEALSPFIMKDFKIPMAKEINPLRQLAPEFLSKALEWYGRPKPIFLHKSCVGCEECYNNCPPKAIVMKNQKPRVNLDLCIRCFCCQELCPKQAVKIKRPLLFRVLSKL